MKFLLLILPLFLSPTVLADINGDWVFADYFCRSSTGQFNKLDTKIDLDINLNFNTDKRTNE